MVKVEAGCGMWAYSGMKRAGVRWDEEGGREDFEPKMYVRS